MRFHPAHPHTSLAAWLLRIVMCLGVLTSGWVQAGALVGPLPLATNVAGTASTDAAHCHDGVANTKQVIDERGQSADAGHPHAAADHHAAAHCCKAGVCACTLNVAAVAPSLIVSVVRLGLFARQATPTADFVSAALSPPLDPPIG